MVTEYAFYAFREVNCRSRRRVDATNVAACCVAGMLVALSAADDSARRIRHFLPWKHALAHCGDLQHELHGAFVWAKVGGLRIVVEFNRLFSLRKGVDRRREPSWRIRADGHNDASDGICVGEGGEGSLPHFVKLPCGGQSEDGKPGLAVYVDMRRVPSVS